VARALLQSSRRPTTHLVFSVQEEFNLRGAMTAAQAQYYGNASPPPLYPYDAQGTQPYAIQVAPNTYVIQRPAEQRGPTRSKSPWRLKQTTWRVVAVPFLVLASLFSRRDVKP